MYTVRCIVYTVRCIVYTVRCIVYTVRCIVHIAYAISYLLCMVAVITYIVLRVKEYKRQINRTNIAKANNKSEMVVRSYVGFNPLDRVVVEASHL